MPGGPGAWLGAACLGAPSRLNRRLPLAVLVIYLVASLVTFFTYAVDKSAAGRDPWRTRESTLHGFALLGGWPGALASQRLLRHKSAKASFQATIGAGMCQ